MGRTAPDFTGATRDRNAPDGLFTTQERARRHAEPRVRGEHLRAFAAADVTNDEDRDILRDKADSLLAVGGSRRFTF